MCRWNHVVVNDVSLNGKVGDTGSVALVARLFLHEPIVSIKGRFGPPQQLGPNKGLGRQILRPTQEPHQLEIRFDVLAILSDTQVKIHVGFPFLDLFPGSFVDGVVDFQHRGNGFRFHVIPALFAQGVEELLFRGIDPMGRRIARVRFVWMTTRSGSGLVVGSLFLRGSSRNGRDHSMGGQEHALLVGVRVLGISRRFFQ